jgi:hypothetical protein
MFRAQMGHSSIQVTVDTYGHLIPGANVCFVDRLDQLSRQKPETTPHQSAPETHQPEIGLERELAEVADLIGGGGWTRTNDLRIVRCTFRRAATWIQSFAVGPYAPIRGRMLAFGT